MGEDDPILRWACSSILLLCGAYVQSSFDLMLVLSILAPLFLSFVFFSLFIGGRFVLKEWCHVAFGDLLISVELFPCIRTHRLVHVFFETLAALYDR